MSSNYYSDGVAAARQHFEEGLIRAGFVERDGSWAGRVGHKGGESPVVVTIPVRFPFKPPRMVPVDKDGVPWSWHRESDGALCLVAEDDHENLWWAEAGEFLEQAKAWFDAAHDGWVDDRPDLDLDRYFELSTDDDRLYVFGDLTPLIGIAVRFDPASNNVMRLTGQGARPPKDKSQKRKYGFVVDVGFMPAPPRGWEDVSALLDVNYALDARIRGRHVSIVVVRYERGGHEGAVVLEVWPNQAGGITARRLLAGSDTDAAKWSRAGIGAPALQAKSVAILGAGALGSFVADGLARGGVGTLALFDADRLMPGNVVRHLIGTEGVGLGKAVAVKRNLDRRFGPAISVQAVEQFITAADDVFDLLGRFDLVINATADFSVTALLNAVAISTSKTVLSVALQNDGDTFRVDVLPPLASGSSLPSSSRESLGEPHFESGCGNPISPTPPAAVTEAASAAVRHAVGLLLDAPITSNGEIRELSSYVGAAP